MKKVCFIILFFCSFSGFSQEWNCFSYEQALRSGNSTSGDVARHEEYVTNEKLNKTLDRLFHEDQRQRRDGEFTFYEDMERAATAFKEFEEGELNHYCDYYQATIIFMHHPEGIHLELATKLADRALELGGDVQPLRWLKCASEDRFLMRSGKPQIWGTQEQFLNGELTREPFDTSAVSEEQRNRCFDGL